jgi:hypothetical protein
VLLARLVPLCGRLLFFANQNGDWLHLFTK